MTSVVRRARAAVAVVLSAAGAFAFTGAAEATGPGFNGKIAFTRVGAGSDGGPLAKTVNLDGTGEAVLKDDLGVFTYNADGSQIAYYGHTGVSVMNADGSEPRTLLPGHGDGYRLAWSPDGSRFMWMTDDANGETAIAIINADGTDYHLILDSDDAGEWEPSWSPTGDQVIFWRLSDWGWEVWIANADGTDAHRAVTTPSGKPGWPSFSPDGARIMFSFDPEGQEQGQRVYVANVDGSDLHSVGPEGAREPTFSPDGQWIAFSGGTGGGIGIFVMRTDGTQLRQITRGPDVIPNWQPLPNEPPNLPPRALGTAQNNLPLALFANAGASFDGDGSIVSYEWRWGDNTPMTPKRYAWHRYAAPGSYLVRLTVTDDDGARSTRKAWVRVE